MKRLALVSLLVASTAFANNKDKADALFKQGKKLSAEKKYAEACPAFEKSMKLDPAIGTQLNIGKCYEDWGLLGKALVAYRAAQKMAHDAKDDREPKIKAIIDELDPNVPRLTIKIPKNASSEGVVVTLDNKPFTTFGESMIIDPGPHTIDYTVDGVKKQKTVPVERGGDSEVTLDIPKDRVIPKHVDDQVTATPVSTGPAPGHTQRLGGLVLGGAGVIAIGVSSLMTLSARGQYNDALEMYCNNAKDMCDPMGLEQTHDARSTANTATVIFIGGAVAVGAGITLYLLAPKSEERAREARYVVPSVTPEGAGVVYGGRF
jgi:serine/threonine-protein kinase